VSTVAVIALGLDVPHRQPARWRRDRWRSRWAARRCPESTTDPQLRRLRNVVEEIAIASGVPVPKVYVLEHEAGINAFAAGYSPSDAVIAVTRGALDRLNRDELQGVIAHEFSHILNGDMRLNIRLIGVLFGILMIGDDRPQDSGTRPLRRTRQEHRRDARSPRWWRWPSVTSGCSSGA
jgi:Zn-dependent protease with chaperone function